jgi:hypothetical protein
MMKLLVRLLPSGSNFESPFTDLQLGPDLGDSLSRELCAEPDSTAPVDDCGRETTGEGMAEDLLLTLIAPPSTCN